VSDDLLTVVVSGFGYTITHAAQVPASALEAMAWPGPDYRFTGIRSPVAALCGITVRSVQAAVVMMQAGTKVRCRACLALLAERGLETSYQPVH
jgi:hypothetical protein